MYEGERILKQYVGVCVCGMCACLYMYNIFKNTKIKPAKNIIQLFCFCNLCELQPEEVQPTEVRPSDSPVYTCVTVGKSLKPLSSYVLTCSLFCFFFLIPTIKIYTSEAIQKKITDLTCCRLREDVCYIYVGWGEYVNTYHKSIYNMSWHAVLSSFSCV